MKSRLNLLVLFAILCTSLPSHSTFAQEAENEQNEEITIEVPAEAVAASEELVASNQIAATANEEKQPSCIKSGVAISPKMNKEQRKELFIRGRITDCEGQIWNIKIIPGSDISKQMTIKSWRFASDKTKELFKIETYSKAVSDAKSS